MAHKKKPTSTATTTTSGAAYGGDSLLERIPENLNEVFIKLQPPDSLTTLTTLSCVSKTLQSSVNKTLSYFTSLDLSTFPVDCETFDGIVKRFGKIKNITLDCLRINDDSVRSFLGSNVEELVLLKCSSLSYSLLASIGSSCYNLSNADRVGWLELTVLASHVHPSVSTMARTLLSGANVVYNGNPIKDLSLGAFLDKFLEKNRKQEIGTVGPRSNLPNRCRWHIRSQVG